MPGTYSIGSARHSMKVSVSTPPGTSRSTRAGRRTTAFVAMQPSEEGGERGGQQSSARTCSHSRGSALGSEARGAYPGSACRRWLAGAGVAALPAWGAARRWTNDAEQQVVGPARGNSHVVWTAGRAANKRGDEWQMRSLMRPQQAGAGQQLLQGARAADGRAPRRRPELGHSHNHTPGRAAERPIGPRRGRTGGERTPGHLSPSVRRSHGSKFPPVR